MKFLTPRFTAIVVSMAATVPAQNYDLVRSLINTATGVRNQQLIKQLESDRQPVRGQERAVEWNRILNRLECLKKNRGGAGKAQILLPRTTAASGSIRGTVYQSDGMTPVSAAVTIAAFSIYGTWAGTGEAEPADQGRYTIGDLPEGQYYVKASSSEYTDLYYDGTTDWRAATRVQVSGGSETGGIDFALDRLDYSGAITGRVTDPDGNPIRECHIVAIDDHWDRTFAEISQDGTFIISGLRSGSYYIQLSYLGIENFVSEWFDDASGYYSASSVTVTEPDTVTDVKFILER